MLDRQIEPQFRHELDAAISGDRPFADSVLPEDGHFGGLFMGMNASTLSGSRSEIDGLSQPV